MDCGTQIRAINAENIKYFGLSAVPISEMKQNNIPTMLKTFSDLSMSILL
jgi:hypothetical protein